jgi:phosphoserine phosphatase
VIRLIQTADAFCFDVDSTVCVDEGIDELAEYLGKGEEVAEMTAAAMGGGVPFREALDARLRAMQPTRSSVDAFVAANPPKLSPGIADLFAALRAAGKEVYLVSGGFRAMIVPVAAALDVPRENIFANDILFKEDGTYDTFDPEAFTSAAGGKARAVKHIKAADGHATMGMVGDGATDLEARVPGGADVFVGYGGVQVREAVEKGADWFVTDFDAFIDVVKSKR